MIFAESSSETGEPGQQVLPGQQSGGGDQAGVHHSHHHSQQHSQQHSQLQQHKQ